MKKTPISLKDLLALIKEYEGVKAEFKPIFGDTRHTDVLHMMNFVDKNLKKLGEKIPPAIQEKMKKIISYVAYLDGPETD